MKNNTKSVVLMDGSMGQELVHRSGKPATPLWATQALLDAPQLVVDLHGDYIRSGARVITLNTYSCTPERLDSFGIGNQFHALQELAARLANEARDKCAIDGVKIAGCLPPLVGSYHPELSPDFDTSLEVYSEIASIQADYVDLFLCETVAAVIDAKAAATAAKMADKPVWVALTIADDGSGLLRSGEPVSDAITVLDNLGVDAKLLNCSKPESIDAAWDDFNKDGGITGAYANGFTSIDALIIGGTVSTLDSRIDLGPDRYAEFAMGWVERGASIVGGCCEVGPAHIAKLSRLLEEKGYIKNSGGF